MCDLVALRSLALAQNALASLENLDFRHFTNLATLDIADNRLTRLPESLFELGASLVDLSVADNRLYALPPAFAQLSALSRLDVTGNELVNVSESLLQVPLSPSRIRFLARAQVKRHHSIAASWQGVAEALCSRESARAAHARLCARSSASLSAKQNRERLIECIMFAVVFCDLVQRRQVVAGALADSVEQDGAQDGRVRL